MTEFAKVYLFGPSYPPSGGVVTYVDLLYKNLVNSNINCIPKLYSGRDLKIKMTWNSILKNFFMMGKGDICLDSSTFFLEYPCVTYLNAYKLWWILKKYKKFKWIKIIHDSTLPQRYTTFSRFQVDYYLKSIDYIDHFIVVNCSLQKWLLENFTSHEKITVVPSLLPLETDRIKSDQDKASPIITKKSAIVTTIGVFQEMYGFEDLITAIDKIRNNLEQEIELVIIDCGFTVNKQYKQRLLKNKAWIKVFENISHSQTLKLLSKSDVFVRGVEFESYGLSRVEAILCETPVIATNVGETRGMRTYKFGDVETLASLIYDAVFNVQDKNHNREIKYWADIFRKEAKSNLNSILELLKS